MSLCVRTRTVAARAQAGRGGNRTSRPCRAVACLSLPEVNNEFFHLALESKEIIQRSPYRRILWTQKWFVIPLCAPKPTHKKYKDVFSANTCTDPKVISVSRSNWIEVKLLIHNVMNQTFVFILVNIIRAKSCKIGGNALYSCVEQG